MALAWSSPVLPVLQEEMSLTSDQVSWIGSFIALGALCAGIPGGWMMEHFGRRTTLLYVCFPFVAAWICLTTRVSLYVLYLGRFVLGLVTGVCLVVVPTYIAETAHVSWRGKLGALMQVL
jgi:MFS family permease